MTLLLASATADAIQSRLPRPSVAAPAALGINALAGSRQKADLPVGRWRLASSGGDRFMVPAADRATRPPDAVMSGRNKTGFATVDRSAIVSRNVHDVLMAGGVLKD